MSHREVPKLMSYDDHNDSDSSDAQDDGYDFLAEGARRDNQTQFGYETHSADWWGLGSHGDERVGVDWDEVDEHLDELDGVPGLTDLVENARQTAERMRATGYECSVCGFTHGHDTEKHDVRDFFGVTEEFADQMHFNPYCHCGVHELARLLNYWNSIEVQVFEHEDEPGFDINEIRQEAKSGARAAEIRADTRNELNGKLGPL